MTEFMSALRLRKVVVGQGWSTLEHTVPVLRWTVDEKTGRPVGHWELADKPSPSGLSLHS
jgi:hypothetical protein